MSWPRSLLSATNRKLRDQAEELAAQLEAKQQACEDASNVVTLLRENTLQAQKMARTTEVELASQRALAEKTGSETKVILTECNTARRQWQHLQGEAERIGALSREAETAIASIQKSLAVEQDKAAVLEAEAKAALTWRLSREKEGEALEAELEALSSSVWAKLSRLNEVVAKQSMQLTLSREEHAGVLRELGNVQETLRTAVRDQQNSVEEMEHVHRESATADRMILVNSEKMRALNESVSSKTELRSRLATTLNDLLSCIKTARRTSEAKKSAYDTKIQTLREIVDQLKHQSTSTEMSRRQDRVHRQSLQRLYASLSNLEILASEKKTSLQQHEEYARQLQDLTIQMERDARHSPELSPTALYATYATLSQELARWEDRLERTRVRLTASIQDMTNEGRRADTVQATLGSAQRKIAEITVEQTTQQRSQRSVHETVAKLNQELSEKRALLPSLQEVSMAQYDERRRQCEANARQLRERLSEVAEMHRHLLEANTSLRVNLRRTKQILSGQQTSLGVRGEEGALLASEVPSLEKELNAFEQRQREAQVEAAKAYATFGVLKAAADGQVGAMKEAVGAQEYVRANMQIEESSIEADMQSARLELHLQQAEVHEQGEELRRQQRRRDLLRSRYEELMQSLTRCVAAPLQEGSGAPGPALPSLGALGNDSAPEALHARLLLQRSFERERLMQAGNSLDLRLVGLERETDTLRTMFRALKGGGAAPPPDTAEPAGSQVTPARLRPIPTNAVATAEKLQCSLDDRTRLLQTQLELQKTALVATHEQSELSRAQLRSARKALQELQTVEKQKQLQLKCLQESVAQARRNRSRGLSVSALSARKRDIKQSSQVASAPLEGTRKSR